MFSSDAISQTHSSADTSAASIRKRVLSENALKKSDAAVVISSAGIALRAAITASVWTICYSQHSSSASVCFADNLIPPAICAYLFNL